MKFMMNGTLQTLVILQLLISGRSQEVPVDSVLVDMQTSQQIDAAPLTSVMSHYKVETTTTFVESGDMFLSERQNLVAEDSVTENFFIEDEMDGVQGDFGSAERELLEVVKSNPLIPADRIPLDLGDSSATEHSPHIAPVVAETHVIETTLKNDQEKAPEEYSDRAAIGADAGRFAIVAAKENLEKAHRSLELEIIDATIPKVHEQSANQQVDEGAEKETILEVHEQSANQQVDEGAEKTPSQQAETSPQDKTVTGSADSVEEATEVVKAESVDDQSHEDDAMQEIMEIQRRELIDLMKEGEMIEQDQAVADEAERVAKALEAAEALEIARLEREAELNKKKQASAENDWVQRSRPGAEAKPGAKLGQTVSAKGSSDYRDGDERSSRGSRDRVPESLRKEATSGSRGNYFAGQNPAETELANRREVKQKAAETDKISAGAGDRRRELEAMLSPEMRNNAAAAQRIRAEQIKEDAGRRARASVARKFARPVEKVISLYNSQKTDLFDVLQVGKSANDATLKKAYRRLALMVHPDKNVHPDSKIAFDAIQEAFETLSFPLKRVAYCSEQRKRSGKPSVKRFMRFWGDEYNNFKSRSLLFLVRVFRKGEWRVEYQEQMGDKVSAIGLAVSHVAEHIVLLPTLIDRIRLVSEISYDSFNWLAAGAFLAALL